MIGRLALASLLALGMHLSGCVVEIGPGHVEPVLFERVMYTGLEPEDGCPTVHVPYLTLDRRNGEANVEPVPGGCLLGFREDDVELVAAPVMREWREQLGGTDLSALLGADLVVNELRFTNGVRTPIDAADLAEVAVLLDQTLLFTREELAQLGTRELRIPVPEDLLERFLDALERGEAVTAELKVHLVFRDGYAVPTLLVVRAELQPILKVDALKVLF